VSRDPVEYFVAAGQAEPKKKFDKENCLVRLRSHFPMLDSLAAGARVLDYGCGDGFQCYGLGASLASHVLGVDINEPPLVHARALCSSLSNVEFSHSPPTDQSFDLAISQNAFEHFHHPEESLRELNNALKPGGKLLLTFGPPWYAPYGAHMHFFTRLPWVNLLFSERTAHRVRSLYRDDGATTYSPNVNKMSIRRFEAIVAQSGFEVSWLKYHTVSNLPVLDRLPIARELFVNRVSCVLTKPQTESEQ